MHTGAMTDKHEDPADQPRAEASPAADWPRAADQPGAPAAEAPPAGEQATAEPVGAQVAAHPPAPRKRPPHRTRTWIAATAAGVMLLGGGVAGYFIGAATDNDHRGTWHQEWNGFRGPDSGDRFGGGDFGGGFGDGPRAPWDRNGDR